MSHAFNLLVRRMLLPGVHDTQAGLKGFTAGAAERIFSHLAIPRFGFDGEVLHLTHRYGFTRAQQAVTFRAAHDAPTTVRFVRDTLAMARDVVRIRRRARRDARE